MESVALNTGAQKYADYIKTNLDHFVQPGGVIKGYTLEEYNLDRINTGKLLFRLYAQTGDERYKQALLLLRRQLATQPRTGEGGFWHKQIYPHQMWLDGLYMASPFYAEFGRTFGEPAAFDDVARQIILMEKHARDPQTGLLYHGWDESKQQRWAHPETGCSPHFWGRAMGWYAMAIVDVLDYFPADHHRRSDLVAIFSRMADALVKVQNQATGLWYQILDQGARAGNYLEASGSCMAVYSIAKAVRQGNLDASYLAAARKGYQGALAHFVRVDQQGYTHLDRICRVGGLGGIPYRDGTFEYYIGEPIVSDDNKGVGPFILAALEMENI
jgi:unsaturated rhamnogalacturonyl hydrolase